MIASCDDGDRLAAIFFLFTGVVDVLRRYGLFGIILACLVPLVANAKHPDAVWTSSRIKGTPDPPPPYRTEQVFEGVTLKNPTEMIRIPTTDRWCVVQLEGEILSFAADGKGQPQRMMDLKDIEPDTKRSYGIVFHRDYPWQPWCYIAYSAKPRDPQGTKLSRFRVNVSDSPTIDPHSEVVLARWSSQGHAGGSLHFGPDGYLYVSVGDGQPPNPPDGWNTGQDLSDLQASILRIDVDHATDELPYGIPPDNPFVDTPSARGEIWAFGLRNPWKMSFDPTTGALWTGDVGWEMREMVYLVRRGANYGWSLTEGSQIVKRDQPPPAVPITPPVVEHTHLEARSVTGGYVYHGDRLPELGGVYLYGDYMTGKIWGLRHDGDSVTWHQELADTPLEIICFAIDEDGEVLIVGYDGTIHRLITNPIQQSSETFPHLLSETGLFHSTAGQIPSRGVLPYEINARHWADGTTSQQWIAAPGQAQLELIRKNVPNVGQVKGHFQFPHDTVLAKTVSYRANVTDPSSARRLETQVLHRHGDDWNAYNYVWNDEQTDATLQENIATERELIIADPSEPTGRRRQTWHHASRDECLLCHIWKAGTVHGFKPNQLNRPGRDAQVNQINRFNQLALFTERVNRVKPTVSPNDTNHALEERARSYLHLNCAHCHRRGGGGTASFVLDENTPLEQLGIIDAPPAQGGFEISDPRVVAAGDPYRSVLLYRLIKSGRGHMPQFGSNVIDELGVTLIHDWIASMDDSTESSNLQRQIAELCDASSNQSFDDLRHSFDQLLSNTSGAIALSIACGNGVLDDTHRRAIADFAGRHPNAQVRELFERFLPEHLRVKRLGQSIDASKLLAMKGDAVEGERLFWESSDVTCRNCHQLGVRGIAVGPNLAGLGLLRTPKEILLSLLDPSAKIEQKYQSHSVLTDDGVVVMGVIVAETDASLRLVDAAGKQQEIPKEEITMKKPSGKSVMPDRLLAGFTAQQAADLMAYLSSRRQPTDQHHKTYRIRRASGKIQVDGKPDEDCWQAADSTGDFIFTWCGDDDGPGQPTEAKMLWDDHSLYVSFRCIDRDVTAVHRQRDEPVYRDDCVEVFASPEVDLPKNYFNLEINALGTLLDNDRPDGKKTRKPWNPEEIEIGVHVNGTLNDSTDDDQGWSVEVAIPFKLLADRMRGPRPAVGDRWRLNLHRLEDNMRIKSQWSAGDRNRESFHTPEFFGFVEFTN